MSTPTDFLFYWLKTKASTSHLTISQNWESFFNFFQKILKNFLLGGQIPDIFYWKCMKSSTKNEINCYILTDSFQISYDDNSVNMDPIFEKISLRSVWHGEIRELHFVWLESVESKINYFFCYFIHDDITKFFWQPGPWVSIFFFQKCRQTHSIGLFQCHTNCQISSIET